MQFLECSAASLKAIGLIYDGTGAVFYEMGKYACIFGIGRGIILTNMETNSKLVGGETVAYIHRSIEERLVKASDTFKAVLVTGPRQVGKSTMLKKVFPDRKYVRPLTK